MRGYSHTLRICIIITFTRQQWLIRGYSHTLRICITYYFYTATMVNTGLQPHTQNITYYFYTATMVNTGLQPHTQNMYYLLLLHSNNG